MRYRVEHSKIKFVSTSGHVILCLFYKQQLNLEHFRTFSEDFGRFLKILRKLPDVHTNISDHFPKIAGDSEDFRRLPNISEQCSRMFRSYRNKCRFVQRLNLVNVITAMTSLISCFHSKRDPCNSLKFI